jgi:hypothetical protein
MRKTLFALGTALVIGFAGTGPGASAGERTAPELSRAYPGESYAQYYYRRGYYRGYRGYSPGAAAAAGVAGLAAGAIIGGAIANQGAAAGPLPKTQDPDFIAFCSRKYRSFDPIDGTYLSRDGNRYECEYP